MQMTTSIPSSTSEVVLPLSQVADLTTLLYLNPELAAYSNVRTAEMALSYFNALSNLPNTMPPLPPGFDARVYVGAQSNVSQLNRAIRDSILAVEGGVVGANGVSEAALDRRGTFVGTLMCPATVQSAQDAGPDFPYSLTLLADLHEGVLQQGDRLRLVQRGSGFTVDAAIAHVSYGEQRITLERSTNPRYAAALADGAGGESRFEAFGIRVIDPVRQARVTYARAIASSGGTPPSGPDVVPAGEFVYDTYQMLYPETRGFGFSDTYLDQRRKWSRSEAFRIRGAADLINAQDPYLSAPGGGTGDASAAAIPSTLQVRNALTVGPGNFSSFSPSNASIANDYVRITASSFAAGFAPSNNLLATAEYASLCGNMVVGYSSATIRSPLIFKDSLRVEGGISGTYFADISGTNASLGDGALVIDASNDTSVVVRDDLRVGATIGVGTSNPDPATSGVRLAVAGDIFATGTVVTLSDSNAKDNIRTISDPLERVGMMTGCTFEMKGLATIDDNAADRKRHAGLIAQDVFRALPEAVYKAPGGSGEESLLSVAYGNLAGLFVEALKELTTRLTAVERKLQPDSLPPPTPL